MFIVDMQLNIQKKSEISSILQLIGIIILALVFLIILFLIFKEKLGNILVSDLK